MATRHHDTWRHIAASIVHTGYGLTASHAARSDHSRCKESMANLSTLCQAWRLSASLPHRNRFRRPCFRQLEQDDKVGEAFFSAQRDSGNFIDDGDDGELSGTESGLSK